MSTTLRYTLAIVTISLVSIYDLRGQSIRIDKLKEQFGPGKLLKIGGGLSANGVYYNGNGGVGRSPFSYLINGNLALNIYGIVNLPFSFAFSNLGGSYTYPIPPNRLSFHPSYKWITGHVGNISMSFSPYTLNGYLFTGAGVDLEPEGAFKGSLIYGRLQRAVEFDITNRTIPAAYERMGFGAKVQFQKEKYRVGMIIFRAWDDPESIQSKPDSLAIYPMDNTVVSLNTGVKIMKQMDFTMEFASSALTRDVRAESAKGEGILQSFINNKASTGFYKAVKSQLQYTFEKVVLGVGYERIDPGYQTLGAYYMNNDLENITINAAQPLFHGKVQIAVNAGYQRDNLSSSKSSSSSRSIGSANISFTPTPKVSATLNYSNFQTYMRIRPQFMTINQIDNFQNLDTLNYSQVSQNANASVNYTVSQSEKVSRVIAFDLSFQETADKQGGVIRNGNGSRFYNFSAMYNTMKINTGVNFSGAFNLTYNTIGRDDFITLGPTAGLNAKLLKKKVSTGISVSYNASKIGDSWENRVLNVRCNAAYKIMKRHVFNLTFLNQSKMSSEKPATNDSTLTLGYNFIFG